MNEFEYRQQMRALQYDQPLAHDLWPAIAGQLGASQRDTSPHPAWSIAAAVFLAVTALFCQHQSLQSHHESATATTWKPRDPRFSAAAIDLAAARQELGLALAQNPDGQSLHTLLARTDRQQRRLQQWARL
ncbi:MAG: hypothetical protein WBW92_01625 [Rhodanobacteraceae bacterium]